MNQRWLFLTFGVAMTLSLSGCQAPTADKATPESAPESAQQGVAPMPSSGAAAGLTPMQNTESLQGGTGGGAAQAAKGMAGRAASQAGAGSAGQLEPSTEGN